MRIDLKDLGVLPVRRKTNPIQIPDKRGKYNITYQNRWTNAWTSFNPKPPFQSKPSSKYNIHLAIRKKHTCGCRFYSNAWLIHKHFLSWGAMYDDEQELSDYDMMIDDQRHPFVNRVQKDEETEQDDATVYSRPSLHDKPRTNHTTSHVVIWVMMTLATGRRRDNKKATSSTTPIPKHRSETTTAAQLGTLVH